MDYEDLLLLPKLNGVTVIGDKRFEDYGLVPLTSEDLDEIFLEVFGFVF